MARVIPDRMCALIDGDFVVFIIGMRVNKPWKIHKMAAGVPGHAAHAEGTREEP
jgi:hypothetical protein